MHLSRDWSVRHLPLSSRSSIVKTITATGAVETVTFNADFHGQNIGVKAPSSTPGSFSLNVFSSSGVLVANGTELSQEHQNIPCKYRLKGSVTLELSGLTVTGDYVVEFFPDSTGYA
jgi:hypothetical protein